MNYEVDVPDLDKGVDTKDNKSNCFHCSSLNHVKALFINHIKEANQIKQHNSILIDFASLILNVMLEGFILLQIPEMLVDKGNTQQNLNIRVIIGKC